MTPSNRIIARLAEEIKRANMAPLLIVHGGGSFGHPFARKYRVAEGYKRPEQLFGFSKTRQAMAALNKLVVYALVERDVPAVALQPSAFIWTRGGRIVDFDRSLILRMLDMGFVPVLYGDAVLDEIQGFAILSGDQLIANLAVSLGTSARVIVCTDVDGLYTSDPKLNSDAKFIGRIRLGELRERLGGIGGSVAMDVTGGMQGKIAELIPALEKGVGIKIINAKKTNRLYKALTSQRVKGTEVTF